MELLVDEARRDGTTDVLLSVLPGDHSALAFYAKLGFEETGAVHEGEHEMRLTLSTD